MKIKDIIKVLNWFVDKDEDNAEKSLYITTDDRSIGGRAFVTVTGITEGFDWEDGQIRASVDKPIIKKYNDRDEEKEKWLFTEKYSGKKYAVCSSCEYRIAKKDKYCRHCGQRLSDELVDKDYIC